MDTGISAITGVVNRGSDTITYNSSTSKQTTARSAGYYTGGTTTVNAVSLNGNAGAGQVQYFPQYFDQNNMRAWIDIISYPNYSSLTIGNMLIKTG